MEMKRKIRFGDNSKYENNKKINEIIDNMLEKMMSNQIENNQVLKETNNIIKNLSESLEKQGKQLIKNSITNINVFAGLKLNKTDLLSNIKKKT